MTRKATRAAARVATAVMAAVAAACTSAERPAPTDGPDRTVTVVVQNNNWLDANIYALSGGRRDRLGTVSSMDRGRFAIPVTAAVGGGVRLAADLVGSRATKVTDRIILAPGDQIQWVLENHLALSSYAVW